MHYNRGPYSRWGFKLSALIFDFDGVIADSEALANTVLAEFITDLGHATNLEDSLEHYSGRRWDDAIAAIDSAATYSARIWCRAGSRIQTYFCSQPTD